MSYIVYLAKHLGSDGEYVGATKHSLERRRKEHISAATRGNGGCRVFCAAIVKYGPDEFAWSILHDGLTLEEAMNLEKKEIAARRPRYNITAGGIGMIGIPRTPEWRAKISASNLGRKMTPEQVAKAKAARPLDKGFKSVVCLEDRRLFESINSAAKYYGTSPHSISSCLHGHQNRSCGKHFALLGALPSGEEISFILSQRAKRETQSRENVRLARSRPIVCLETGEIFPSSTAASLAFGV